MAAFKNKDNGTWYVQFRYTDWKGERQQKLKRGFATKREALEWEREFLMEKQADVNMTFESFVALYERDIKPKLKLNTWLTKESIIKKKILPYFAKRKLSEITAKDIMRWQNEIREMRDCHGKPLSKTYLKTVHNQLSAIFNHAARFYGLNINPARQAGNMGAEERKEMLFWTREEYTKFSEAMMDKPLSFYAFEVLYWCGIREGELLALTPADFDFEKRTLTINKSYQRLNKQDVITTPKTPKSNRVIQMPQFLCDELQDYLKQLYGVEPDSRMFPISKSYLHREMDRGCKQTGVKRIRIHDLRHSHISLLIDMGFTALAIAERVGHESIDITYRYAHLGQHIIHHIKHRTDQPRADGEPHQHRKGRGQNRSGQQSRQPRQGCGQRGHYRVHENVHPAAAGPVQFKDGKQAKQDPACNAPGNRGVGQIQGVHGGNSRLIEVKPHHRAKDGEQHDQPGQPAAEQTSQLQGEQPKRLHCTASREIR